MTYFQLDLASSSSALSSPTQEREQGAAGFTQHEEAMDGRGVEMGEEIWGVGERNMVDSDRGSWKMEREHRQKRKK